MPTAAGIYARISEDRNGEMLGITRQVTDCDAYAALKGWPVVEHYCDDDFSAYSGKPRPAYRRLLEDIGTRRIDAVVVWHLDRLHRNPKELEEFFEVCDAAKVSHIATVTGDIDLSSHDGKFQARILGAVARKESDDKSRRSTRKHLEIAQAGRWAGGRRPYGYTNDREVIPEEAEVIREAARRLLAGETLWSVTSDFNLRNIATARGKKWSGHTLKHIVIHPRIAGHRALKDRIVAPAVWDAILSDKDFQSLRSLLTDDARRTSRSARRYLLSSLLRCRLCNAKLISRPSHGQPAHACASGPGFFGCGKISIVAAPLEAFIAEAVLFRLDSPALTRALQHQPDSADEFAELEIAIATDQAKTEELAGFWADGKIESAEYFVARKRITDRLTSLRARFHRLDRHSAARRLAGQSENLRRQWAQLNLHQRRGILTAVLDHVVVGPALHGSRFDPSRLQPVWRV
jgi:DNA invertase Pin-like site-specific DNA recombinase